jgi:hypothetical protein
LLLRYFLKLERFGVREREGERERGSDKEMKEITQKRGI